MIDIHCHILPGIDDGAENLDESLAMARVAYEDGVRHIVATPHFTSTYPNNRILVEAKVKELQAALDGNGIAVAIHPGNEVRLEDAAEFYRHTEERAYCMLDAEGKFILLEQKWTAYNPDTPAVIAWLLARGTVPIIPHPERHDFFRRDPALLDWLIDAGAWTQVSVDSLVGRNNEEVRRFSLDLIDRNRVSTLATDAHNIRRKPNLAEGFRIVAERAGAQRAEEILRRLERIIPAGAAKDRGKA